MSATGSPPLARAPAAGGGLGNALAAMRTRLALVALLFALAALAWWSTADRMSGMDAGPGTDLGAFGWFVGVWVVMMAAMMFPSVSPTVALYAKMTRRRGLSRSLLFTSGYLLVWSARGSSPTASSTRAGACSAPTWAGTAAAGGSREACLPSLRSTS